MNNDIRSSLKKEKKKTRPVSHYDRYFDGYIEYRLLTTDGKTKTVRVYADDYWKADTSDTGFILKKVLILILFLTEILGLYEGSVPFIPGRRLLIPEIFDTRVL